MSETVIPPDGDWGWACVVGGMIINFINGGIIMMFRFGFTHINLLVMH